MTNHCGIVLKETEDLEPEETWIGVFRATIEVRRSRTFGFLAYCLVRPSSLTMPDFKVVNRRGVPTPIGALSH